MYNRFESYLQQYTEWGGFLLRMILGVVFLAHGYAAAFIYTPAGEAQFLASLGFPLPAVSAWLLIVTHFAGGAMILLGLFTRLNALVHTFVMAMAVFTAHLSQGFFLKGIVLDAANGVAVAGGYEFALTLAVASLSLAFVGPGVFALDRAVGVQPQLRPSTQS